MQKERAILMQRKVDAWIRSLSVDAECVLGGSIARDESSSQSDIDLYCITSFRGAYSVLSSASQFRSLFAGTSVSLVVLPRQMMKWGMYYFEGVNMQGQWRHGVCVGSVQARSALRTAYASLVSDPLHKEQDSWYRMRKALYYSLCAYGLCEGLILEDTKTVFSFAFVHSIVWPKLCHASPVFSSLDALFTEQGDKIVHRTLLIALLCDIAKHVSRMKYPWQLRVLDAVAALRQGHYAAVWRSNEYDWYLHYARGLTAHDATVCLPFADRYMPIICADVV